MFEIHVLGSIFTSKINKFPPPLIIPGLITFWHPPTCVVFAYYGGYLENCYVKYKPLMVFMQFPHSITFLLILYFHFYKIFLACLFLPFEKSCHLSNFSQVPRGSRVTTTWQRCCVRFCKVFISLL